MFLAAGLTPGVQETVQSTLGRYPELIPPEIVGQMISFFTWVQRISTAFGLLCMFGGWGAHQNARWGRWTAMAASILNLLVFIPMGIGGIIVFSKPDPLEEKPEAKSAPEASTKVEPVSHVFVMVASLAIVVYMSGLVRKFAAAQGLPVEDDGRLGLVWILVGQLVFTIFHELGHLVAAWAVGFQFHEINVGPFTLTQRAGGSWGFKFNYEGILTSGGYLQAVPRSEKDLRMNFVLVVIAGPAVSLITAMIGFLTLVSLHGTPYAEYWKWAAFVTSICTADFLANLLPLGSADGALLLHTALGTKRGKGILAGLKAAMLNNRIDRTEGLIDPAEILQVRRQALEHLEKNSEAPELAVAVQRIEFAAAALRNGRIEEAETALHETGKKLEAIQGVPNLVWFRFWQECYETATAGRKYSFAADARERALQYGDKLHGDKLDWDTLVPVRVGCARLLMSDGDYLAAILVVQETRAACPSRRAVTAFAVELLAVEGECELRLGRQDSAKTLNQAAIELAQALPDGQLGLALELLAHAAVRLSAAGDYSFAQPFFEAAVSGIESSAAGSVSAGYRTAWAEALYENGDLEGSKAVLSQLDSSVMGASADIDNLRAQLLLAEDRPADAVKALNSILSAPAEELDEHRQLILARSRALRAWAHYRSGASEDAMTDARKACDVLMPSDHPDSAPALLTLAMAVESENRDLAEAYLQESSRLICESTLLLPVAKASRLTDLARNVVQAGRKDWGKRLLELAAKVKAEPVRGSAYMGAKAAV